VSTANPRPLSIGDGPLVRKPALVVQARGGQSRVLYGFLLFRRHPVVDGLCDAEENRLHHVSRQGDLFGDFVELGGIENGQRIFLAVDRAGFEREVHFRHAERNRRDAEHLAEQQPFRARRHAQFDAGEILRGHDLAPLAQVELARAEIRGRQDLDAHPVGHHRSVARTQRAIEYGTQMGVIAQQVGAVEEAIFRKLLGDLECRHGAHLKVAALKRRHLGTLTEQG